MRRFLTRHGAAAVLLPCALLALAFPAGAQEADPDYAAAAEITGNAYGDADGNAYGDADTDAVGDAAETETAAAVQVVEELHPDAARLEMEIRTSSLMELASWARELGLSDGGTREDLASRLRAHYRLPSPFGAAFVEQRVITIESAVTTEYFTLDVVNEDYARFRGNVVISLMDGNAVHRIRAQEILYNRTRNVLTASGGVEYVREEGSTVETFRGDSITVNLDNWSGIFIDGVSERSIAGNPTAYRFAGTIISRSAEGATVLTGAEITNPANEEAFWSITASRLWLLPGNDFAILNAVLRVGNIPLFYIPFFYFPADQVVFRPVLGFRTREGTFLQTTTYLLGRPRADVITESSISMIFGGADEGMETRREGIFLRTTGERRQDPSDIRLSVLFDAYVNLGAYMGMELNLPRRGPLGEIAISAGLGFTRNIYQIGHSNTPFLNHDGVSDWNRSSFFFLDLPVRYRFRMTGSYQIPFGSLSWDIPFYSDPFVDRDFMRRPQPRDWFSMLREFAEGEGLDDEHAANTIMSSYDWRLSGNFTFPAASLRPFVNTLSISNIFSSLTFNVRNSPPPANPASPPNPEAAFFFPSRFTVYSINAVIAGNPLSLGAAPPGPALPAPGQEPPGIALLPDVPISPWPTVEVEEDTVYTGVHAFSPPALAQTFHLRPGGRTRFSVDYRLTPTTSMEMQFDSSPGIPNAPHWREQEDVDWGQISTILSRFRTDGNMGFVLDHPGGNATLRFTGTGEWQGFMYLNEDAEEFATGPYDDRQPDHDRIQATRDRAEGQTQFRSNWDFSTTLRPFFQSAVWGNTSLVYNARGLLARNTFDMEAGTRNWEFQSWDDDRTTGITAHTVGANIAANIMDHNQTISISAVLPPLDASASANATFNKWISTTSIRASVQDPWDDDRVFNPIHITETLTFTPRINFQQVVVVDPERNQYTTLTSRLNLWSFNASYSVLYATPWRFNPYWYRGSGLPLWEQQEGERLEPREFSMGHTMTFSRDNLWGRRLGFSVNFNSRMAFNLQRYTDSRMDFSMNFTARITNFLDISFATVSENAVLFRYFQHMPFFDAPPAPLWAGYETNFFTDLINSFRFDDPELRRLSGFNLRSINVSLIHHLGDWNARLTVQSTPRLDPAAREYRFNNEISFLVQWVPIGEIRTQIDYTEQRLRVR
ncbi:MAG: LPS-assembly protein LptD [Treponema sp.]|nr:LPS-assembly protein LptD [Treponema sp.]